MSEIASLILRYFDALRTRDWERLEAFYDADVQYVDPELALGGCRNVIARAQVLEAPFSDVVLKASRRLTLGHLEFRGRGRAPRHEGDRRATLEPPEDRRMSLEFEPRC